MDLAACTVALRFKDIPSLLESLISQQATERNRVERGNFEKAAQRGQQGAQRIAFGHGRQRFLRGSLDPRERAVGEEPRRLLVQGGSLRTRLV